MNTKLMQLGVMMLTVALYFPIAQAFANEDRAIELKREISPQILMERALENIPKNMPFGSSFDPATGHTVVSIGQADGSHNVTEYDKNGKVIRVEKVPAQGQSLPSAEAFNPDNGHTTRVQGNADGTRTITETDKDGKEVRRETVDPNDPKNKLPWGQATDPDTGITTTVQGNADGSRTVTQTDANGKVISTEVRR